MIDYAQNRKPLPPSALQRCVAASQRSTKSGFLKILHPLRFRRRTLRRSASTSRWGDVLPLIKSVKVLEGFDAGGVPRLRDPRGPVTLRHLLTHTSGYGYDIFNPDIRRYVEIVGLPSIMSRKNGSLRVPLLFDPGTGWEYGIGIDLAGKVVETVTGQSLEAYFRQHIFEPLGMRDTSFLLSDDMARRLVGTHHPGRRRRTRPRSASGSHRRMATSTQAAPDCLSTAPDYRTSDAGSPDDAEFRREEATSAVSSHEALTAVRIEWSPRGPIRPSPHAGQAGGDGWRGEAHEGTRRVAAKSRRAPRLWNRRAWAAAGRATPVLVRAAAIRPGSELTHQNFC